MSTKPQRKSLFEQAAEPDSAQVIDLKAHYKVAEPMAADYFFVADVDRENGDTHIIRGYD